MSTVDLTQAKYSYLGKENEMDPALQGVCSNLVVFPWISSPTRMYMVGNMIPKSVDTNGRSERKIIAGSEYQYAKGARRIEAPSNMIIEEVFYVHSPNVSGEVTDKWSEMWLLFKNDELNAYDILVLPKYNTQNTYIGFEYVYDETIMSRIEKNARFPKGTIFGQSPRISKSGEWMFGMDLKVCTGSFHFNEEDGIAITDWAATEKLKCMFKHSRGFSWNEDEYVPLLINGTDDNPKPLPESGERIRPDGIVMGFRKRNSRTALTTLTKKALRTPDINHDILFHAPINSEVMSVEVLSERMKDRSNNRSTDYVEQTHTKQMDRYERRQNDMWNSVIRWYNTRLSANAGNDLPLSNQLDTFVRLAFANYTRSSLGKVNPLFRGNKRVKLKDWNVTILLREMVPGRVKFKMTGMNGDKGVIVKIIPRHMAPRYADGTVCDVIINNVPAFRRQIFSMLLEQSVNFINMHVHREVVALRKIGNYEEAFAKLLQFFDTGFPEFGELVRETIFEPEIIVEYVDHVAKTQISVQVVSNTKLYGVAIIRALREVYSYKPERILFTDSLGEEVMSDNPVLITHQHFMLLDKFGTDMSAQALPLANPFGMPTKPNDVHKYGDFLQNKPNRNKGETEARLSNSQSGAQEINKNLALANSPELRTRVNRRILRADDPFDIDQIVKPEEYQFNSAVSMSASMLSDSGYALRREIASDRTEQYFIPTPGSLNLEENETLKGMMQAELPEESDVLIGRDRMEPVAGAKQVPNPAALRENDEFGKMLHSKGDAV